MEVRKLTDSELAAIRIARANGVLVKEIAKRHGVTRQTVSAVTHGPLDPAYIEASKKRLLGFVQAGPRGCWIYCGYANLNRHRPGTGPSGSFRLKGRGWLAHRASYMLHRGPIPQGLTIDHLCRNTLCINPNHLEAVTDAENKRRAALRRRTTWR